jgi:hypothetical protein
MNSFRVQIRILRTSIGVGLVFFLFTGWVLAEKTVKVRANYSNMVGLASVKKDLAKLDAYATAGQYGDAGVLVGQDIKARDVYRAYLTRAGQMSDELLSVRVKLEMQANTISLQQLGALAQRLTLNNQQFKGAFRHGESHFQTYQLIEKAVKNLEDAINYWRISNRYQRFYRGSVQDKAADDEILKTKLQAALNAIDELKTIVKTREALSRDLTED